MVRVSRGGLLAHHGYIVCSMMMFESNGVHLFNALQCFWETQPKGYKRIKARSPKQTLRLPNGSSISNNIITTLPPVGAPETGTAAAPPRLPPDAASGAKMMQNQDFG